MSKVCLIFNYDSKEFMDINKITTFKKNYKRIKEKDIEIKLFFYGEASNEELATFMSYFNSLVQEDVCDISVSFKTKSLVISKGLNNKSIKLSASTAKEIKDNKFDNIINDYYQEEMTTKIMPTFGWQMVILDLIGE